MQNVFRSHILILYKYRQQYHSSILYCKIKLDENINVNEIAQLLNAIV